MYDFLDFQLSDWCVIYTPEPVFRHGHMTVLMMPSINFLCQVVYSVPVSVLRKLDQLIASDFPKIWFS